MPPTIWLGAYRSDRAAHAVRLIQFRKGNRTFSYITNVLRLYSRIQPDVPHICIVDITPLPPDLTLLRTARYAHRNPHPRTADYTPLFTNQLLI
jgi:hypothetical protein